MTVEWSSPGPFRRGHSVHCRSHGFGPGAHRPANRMDAVAAHIQNDAAAGPFDIPEPGRVWPSMTLRLLHQKRFAHLSALRQFLHPLVHRHEHEVFGIHQHRASLRRGCDHRIGLGQAHRQRLLTKHMFAGLRSGNRDLRVKVVRHRNRHRVDRRVGQHFPPVGVVAFDVPAFRERRRGVGRSDRRHLNARDLAKRMAVQVADELGANKAESKHSRIVRR